MAIRKNKKRIDPRYFLHETTYRDDEEMEVLSEGISLRDALQQSQQNGQRIPQNSLGGGGGVRYPVIKISDNQYVQLSQFIQYQGNQQVLSGYTVEFSTRLAGGKLTGTDQIGSGAGANGSEAAVEEAIQYMAGQGVDVDSTEPGVSTQ